MPRKPRVISSSHIYHLILRSVNRQNIFLDEADSMRFLETIKKYKAICKFEIFAYCIMSNHIHILIRENEDTISNIIQRISSSYVLWYNKRHKRCGHLFQERFRSEAVESEDYFLTALRYIHRNPVKAHIVSDPIKYKWSSYKEYCGKPSIADTDFALDILSADRRIALYEFQDFNTQNNEDICLDLDDNYPQGIPDRKLHDCLRSIGIDNSNKFLQLDKASRLDILNKLNIVDGISIRQLSRVLGVSRSVISKTLRH